MDSSLGALIPDQTRAVLPDLFMPWFKPFSISHTQLIASALSDIIIPHKFWLINRWNWSLAEKSICRKNKATLPWFESAIIGGQNVKNKCQYWGNDVVLDRTLMKSKYELFAWLRLFVAGDKDSRLRETLRSDCYRFPRQEKQHVKNDSAEINHERPAWWSRWWSCHEWAETFAGLSHRPKTYTVKRFKWSGCSTWEESLFFFC